MVLFERLGVHLPLVQAPMAGVSTARLAAAVSNAGGLGSIAIGAAANATQARSMIEDVRALTRALFNVNVFAHASPRVDVEREDVWREALAPLFARFGAVAPQGLSTIYTSYLEDAELQAQLLEAAAPVISFHFGLPRAEQAAALKKQGSVLLATATSLAEAQAAKAIGIDAVVAQGWEAGGHRGVFDPAAPDDRLGTIALTRLLVDRCGLPVIAAGGVMDGYGVRAALALGAQAVQLGTAFIACPESSADDAYRAVLRGEGALHTVMTAAISGRPARCLSNAFTRWAAEITASAPDYPRAYDAGKALNAFARAAGEAGFGAQWAGQGAPLSRSMPAAELVKTLMTEGR